MDFIKSLDGNTAKKDFARVAMLSPREDDDIEGDWGDEDDEDFDDQLDAEDDLRGIRFGNGVNEPDPEDDDHLPDDDLQ